MKHIPLLTAMLWLAFSMLHLDAQTRTSKKKDVPVRGATASEFQSYWKSRPELDVVFFVEDLYPPVKARIKRWNSKTVWLERGEQSLEFPIDQIRAIELHHSEGDQTQLETASLTFLREACEWRKAVLEILDHHERSWFERYLERLILEKDDITFLADLQWARKFLPEDATLWQGYLDEWIRHRSQRRSSPLSAKIQEAKHFVEHGHWVPRRLMLHYLKILADHEQHERLKLEEDHPKWADDDEIKPQRQRHFHLSLDMRLYASLFESDLMEPSSQGLLEAGRLVSQAADPENARHWWTTLIQRYPTSPYVTEAKQLLLKLPPIPKPPDKDKTSSPVPETPSDAAPPTLLRFSLFEE